MSLTSTLKKDWIANKGNSKGRVIVAAYRISNYIHYSKNYFIRIIGYPFKKLYHWTFIWIMGIEIPEETCIGESLQVWHGEALVINRGAVIGSNVLLRHCTTIGNKYLGSKLPRIGNNVEIGSHCVIIGDIEIGDNVVIGAGSVVTKSIPANCVAFGNPAQIKYRNDAGNI